MCESLHKYVRVPVAFSRGRWCPPKRQLQADESQLPDMISGDLNSCPREEQQVCLTAEPPLKSPNLLFKLLLVLLKVYMS